MRRETLVVLLVLLLAITSLGAQADQGVMRPIRGEAGPEELTLPDTIIIGWDGVQRDHFWECYNKQLPECPNGLPNIELLSGGTIFDWTVTDGATDTKAGWVQILSGYNADVTGVYSNLDYQPMPEGHSVFEKLQAYYGEATIDTVFVSGKGVNVAGTCPGEQSAAGWIEKEGEPWCLAKRGIDTFVEAGEVDIPNETVGARALQQIDEHYANRANEVLVAFFHFAEPDHSGHAYGEDSVGYSQALIDLDQWLGTIIGDVQARGAGEETLFYVLTDHGFDEDTDSHLNAPYGIFATNDPLVIRSGDRKDLAPTLLERYGVEPEPGSVIPPVDGHSLYSIPLVSCIAEGGTYLDYPGAPECCADLSLVDLARYDDFCLARDRCLTATGGTGDSSGYCVACGDGVCTGPESVCNCPLDCDPAYGGFGRGGGLLSGPAPLVVECPLGTVKTTLLSEAFSSWPPAGWSVVNNGGNCAFANSYTRGRPNNTGGSSLCADADSDWCGPGTTMDTELRTPVLDLSGVSNTYLQYKSFYLNYLSEDMATVDISTDGGDTWINLVTWDEDYLDPTTVDLDLTPYSGSAETILRWRYIAPGWDWYWEIDDVDIAICAPAPADIYLLPEEQDGAACPGGSVGYELSLWNDTGSDDVFTLSYGGDWTTHGPDEIFVAAGETVSFSLSVEVQSNGVNTTTVTANSGGFQAEAQMQTWGHLDFEFGTPAPTFRGDLAVVAAEEWLYAMGGTTNGAAPGSGTNERLDTTTGSWATMTPMPSPLTLIDGAEIDGTIYIPGGYDGSAFTAATLAYDTTSDTWTTRAVAPRNVAGYKTVACDGLLYRVGGSYEATWRSGDKGAEVYDPGMDSWSALPPMNHGHLWPGVACLNGKLYVAGGVDVDKQSATSAEVYHIAAGYWDDNGMADLPVDWWGSADFVVDDVLFLSGGRFAGEERGATFLHDLYYYPNSDYWIRGPSLQDARFRLGGASAQNVGYVLGGWGDLWNPLASTEVLRSCTQPGHDIIYVSSTSDGNAGGVSFKDEDIMVYDPVAVTWSLYFDGSDVGLSASSSQDIDAFDLLADGSILFSIVGDTDVPGVGYVDDSDIVRFIPTALGPDTAGSFEMYFDGSDVGLAGGKEDVDAVYLLADGSLVLSTVDSFGVPGASGKDEDLVLFTPTSLGSNTSGSWELYFDGSDVALNDKNEDINGLWVDEVTGDIYMSTLWTFYVEGSSGDGSDILICHPTSLGSNTSCTFGPGLYWDGSAHGFAGEIVDGMAVGFGN